MVTYRGFTAFVTYNHDNPDEKDPTKMDFKHVAPEYSIQPSETTISCCIAGTPETPFRVHWRDEGSGLCSAGFVVVDGKTYPGRFITGLEEVFRSDGKDKDGNEVPFKFKKLSTSGDPGVIELKITFVKPKGMHPLAAIGSEKRQISKDTSEFEPLNNPNKSHVKFRFIYRPPEKMAELGYESIPPSYSVSYLTFMRIPDIARLALGGDSKMGEEDDVIPSDSARDGHSIQSMQYHVEYANNGEGSNKEKGRSRARAGEGLRVQYPANKEKFQSDSEQRYRESIENAVQRRLLKAAKAAEIDDKIRKIMESGRFGLSANEELCKSFLESQAETRRQAASPSSPSSSSASPPQIANPYENSPSISSDISTPGSFYQPSLTQASIQSQQSALSPYGHGDPSTDLLSVSNTESESSKSSSPSGSYYPSTGIHPAVRYAAYPPP